ncbi:CHAT domain-containing protein [Mycena epipterygia]|nr:CHAT domain-containing protein [Mycena epipterygia]
MEAIGLIQKTFDLEENGLKLAETGTEFSEVFDQTGDYLNLDMGISALETAAAQLTWGHNQCSSVLGNLGNTLFKRFRTRGSPHDLDNSIILWSEALALCPEPHPDRHMSLRNLATGLRARFKTRGDVGDLDSAIVLDREALDLCPALHPEHCSSLNYLATVLHEWFQTGGDAEDLDNAIELRHEALDLRPAPHLEHVSSLNNLGIVLQERFETRGDAEDLDNAIELHREALDLCPVPHPDRGDSLNNLASALRQRLQTRDDAGDLDNAIELHREALDSRSAPHPERSVSLNNLAVMLYKRFQTRGDAKDLENAIELHHEALALCPALHPERGGFLSNLANLLHRRFQIKGNAGDLDNAIELHREALDLRPAPHLEHVSSLNNLGIVLQERFQTRGDVEDIENAIELHHEALDLCPALHPNRGGFLSNLANALHRRFQTRRDGEDLHNAIKLHHEALDLCPAAHPEHHMSLNNLANALYEQFKIRGDAEDLDNAIELLHKALHLHPAPHPDRGSSLNNLAHVLQTRFQTRGDVGDLDSAIKLCTEAQDVMQPPHPLRGIALGHLAGKLMNKYANCSHYTIMEDAIIALRESSGYLPSPVSHRCNIATTWAQYADKHNHDSALEAYQTSVELLPQQAMLGLDIQSRQKALMLKSTIGLATDAAACASRLNEIGKAVEFLEAGRSVFWSQALQLHASLDDLEAAHPKKAERIRNISKKLEVGSHRAVASIRMLPAVHKDHMMLDKDDAHYRKLNAEWVEALNEVRQQPGFQRLLRPKLIDELKAAAINGPIIILNVSRSSCTAFIVTLSEDVQPVNLENLTWDRTQLLVDLLHALLSQNSVHTIQTLTKIQGREVSTGFPMPQERLKGTVETSEQQTPNRVFGWLLQELWTLIVQPVFHALELKKSDHPSRLWWCPTGPLTFLPIHAAGIYSPHDTDCVSDYVVSSYTHALTTLLNPPTQTASPFKMTAVIQPTTDNCSDLPATVEELTQIKQQVPSQWLTSLGDTTPATVNVTLQHLQESSIVHFACHGTQDLQNPIETGLLLTDGRLKVSELMQGKSQKKSMTLAFLSACETAKGDDTMPDEAMHLAATLLFAGFRGVVATMW